MGTFHTVVQRSADDYLASPGAASGAQNRGGEIGGEGRGNRTEDKWENGGEDGRKGGWKKSLNGTTSALEVRPPDTMSLRWRERMKNWTHRRTLKGGRH